MSRIRKLLVLGAENVAGRQIAEGIHSYCSNHGRWAYCLGRDNSPEEIALARSLVRHWKPDGIIASVRTPRMMRFACSSGLPVVNVGASLDLQLPAVHSDYIEAGRTAARYFMDNGFRRFAYCALTYELYAKKRYEGFSEELARAGLDCSAFTDECVGQHEKDYARNRARMDRWLMALKKPVAIACVHTLRGREVVMACCRLRLQVPGKVAVLAIGDEGSICKMCDPPLTGMDLNMQQVGYEAARLIARIINGGSPPARPVLVKPREIIVRGSSDSLAVEDSVVSAAIGLIRRHGERELSVDDLLKELPVSKRTLEIRFAKSLRRSPRDEILRARLERARKMLRETDMSVKAIAYACGFEDPKWFMTFFRNRAGRTPTAYRRDHMSFGASF